MAAAGGATRCSCGTAARISSASPLIFRRSRSGLRPSCSGARRSGAAALLPRQQQRWHAPLRAPSPLVLLFTAMCCLSAGRNSAEAQASACPARAGACRCCISSHGDDHESPPTPHSDWCYSSMIACITHTPAIYALLSRSRSRAAADGCS